jgi:hypothetical protein
MIKIGRFFEEHIEKIVLVIVGLFCAWLLITRVIFSPNQVPYGDSKYSPGAIDDKVYEQARDLRQKLDATPSTPELYTPKLPEFLAKFDSALSDIDVSLWPLVPYESDLSTDLAGGGYRLPRIGEVNDVAVEHIRAAAYVPTVDITPEQPYDKAENEPNDIDLVTVEAKFDIAGLCERFNYSFIEDVEERYADPCLAKPIFASVQLQRQEIGDDGTWSDWQIVPRSKIDHNRKLFEIVEDAENLPAGRLKVWMLQFDNKQLQIDLLQPEAYQIASAKEEWYPPTIHRKFLDIQRREESEERRKEREEERKDNERTDSRRISRRGGTRSGIGTGGRTGRGAYSSGAGVGGIYGGQDTRRRSGRGTRRRSTDDSLGVGMGLRSGDRRSRSSRGRTDTGIIDDYMMPGLPGDRLTRRGPSMNDVYEDYHNVLLTWGTDLSKMREPLSFWAHDDTVEPGKSYRYRIRLGFFNPLAGKDQLSKKDMSRKNQVVLWSEFSDVTEPVEIPKRMYFFAKRILEAANVVTVQVSKYVMGYWRSEDFKVSQGEVIGGVVENEPERPETRRLNSRTRIDPRSRLDMRGVPDPRMGSFVAPKEEASMPETIDYSTGAVMVDAVAVNDWSSEKKTLTARRYYDMLYSFNGIDIEHMPIRTSYWAQDVQSIFSEINVLSREKPEPFKDFGTASRRRGTRETDYYDEYGDEYYMEEMMMEGGGRPLY